MAESSQRRPEVAIAGGGIAGLATALTLHQIGVSCVVVESVAELRPLGVGINIQPNAVRELFDLGIGADQLDTIGIQAKEWALVGRNGQDLYSEPRGLDAGYEWPQYSVHRGQLQMLLYRNVIDRLGPDAVRTGMRVNGYTPTAGGVTAHAQTRAGERVDVDATLLVACDGLHSAVRAQMHPDQPPINWGGAIMWRGTTQAAPIRTGASFVGLGTFEQRIVFYPIGPPDPTTGLAEINWIAEVTVDPSEGWGDADWTRKVDLSDWIHHFDGWEFDWMDVQALLRGSDQVYEYPMVDRDPIPTGIDGHTVLLGDAAHAMYPTGSNGASQAIVDARVLGACLLEHGVSAAALDDFDARLREPISSVVLRNRAAGPFGLLKLIDERSDGDVHDIDAFVPAAERAEFMRRFREAAGFAKDQLNAAPPTIAPGATIRR